MKTRLCLLLCLLLLPALSWGLSCEFAWEPVTTNVDGSPLTDLAGYHLYQAPQAGGPYTRATSTDAATTTATLPCQERTAWVVTAYDQDGNESGHSNEVQIAPVLPPGTPSGLQLHRVILEFGR